MKESDAIAMLGALSQETRLRILRQLIGRGEDGASAGEIAEAAGASASRASFHLAALEKAGVIASERRARHIIYRAEIDAVGALISFLLNDCCAGDPRVWACCDQRSARR